MNSHFLVEVVETAVNLHVAHYDIAYRSRAHKVLLSKTERLTLRVVIVGVEHLGNGVRNIVSAERARVVACVERRHIERHTLRAPKTELGNALAVVARNVHIIRNSAYAVVIYIFETVVILVPLFLYMTVKAHLDSLIGNRY